MFALLKMILEHVGKFPAKVEYKNFFKDKMIIT